MKVFVGLSFNRDHETEVVCASDCRETCRRCVELYRNEMLSWARYAVDGPDGGAALDDSRGDMVGRVLAFDVAGSAMLDWQIEDDELLAQSGVYHDGAPLRYVVRKDGDVWAAKFEDSTLATGTLEQCMTACRKSEDAAILQAIQNPPKASGENDEAHGKLLAMLKRFLDPEDLGLAVPAFIRDDVREVLGMPRCEQAKN